MRGVGRGRFDICVLSEVGVLDGFDGGRVGVAMRFGRVGLGWGGGKGGLGGGGWLC